MSPEVIAAAVGGVAVLGAAVIAAVPALLTILRRTRGAVEAEGTATRDAVTALGAVVTALRDELRTDVAGVREDVTRVREWQAGHDAEHLLIGRNQNRGDA